MVPSTLLRLLRSPHTTAAVSRLQTSPNLARIFQGHVCGFLSHTLLNLRYLPVAQSRPVSRLEHSGVPVSTFSHPPTLPPSGRMQSHHVDLARRLCNDEHVPSGTCVSPRFSSDHDHRRAGRHRPYINISASKSRLWSDVNVAT